MITNYTNYYIFGQHIPPYYLTGRRVRLFALCRRRSWNLTLGNGEDWINQGCHIYNHKFTLLNGRVRMYVDNKKATKSRPQVGLHQL
jgi:hypothetical protein